MDYKVVLFDAGNTLWFQGRSGAQVWQRLLEKLGVQRSLNEIENAERMEQEATSRRWDAMETSGRPNALSAIEAIWETHDVNVLHHLGVTLAIETVRSRILPWFDDVAETGTVLYPETVEVLDTLRARGYRMAIVSNGVYQERTAKSLGIEPYFEAIIGSLHVGFRKPMPEIFALALSSQRVGSDEAVMVGDNWQADVVGARAAGIKAIYVDRSSDASLTPESVTDLNGVLTFLEGQRRPAGR